MKPLFDFEEHGFVTPCWIWKRCILPKGYGYWWPPTNKPKRSTLAHKVMWEMQNGPVPKGLELDHLCRNRACVRPDHLEAVTRRTNLRRGIGTKLNEIQVADIRAMRELGMTYPAIASHFGIHHTWPYHICKKTARNSW